MNNEIDVEELKKEYAITHEEFLVNVDDIFKELSINTQKVEKPQFNLIAGKAGAGKTDLVAKKYRELNGNSIIIDQDELRTKYPKNYSDIVDKYDDRIEYQILKSYITNMIKALVDRSRENGYNVILESAFQKINRFIAYTKEFKKDGYDTHLSLMAVTDLESYISMLYRYCYFLEKDGICRRNTKIDLNDTTDKVYDNLSRVSEDEIFDDIEIYIRNSDRDALPIITYSSKESYNKNPEEEYLKAKEQSIPNTLETFENKYTYISNILQKYKETEKLATLEQLHNKFLVLESEGR